MERIAISLFFANCLKKNYFCTGRRDARVVEWGGLENRCTPWSTKGSNPFLSAESANRRLGLIALFLYVIDGRIIHSYRGTV